ncbi:SH3 domain-containing protein, partial [Oceanicola sp. S124]|uniref:SH3 domain-containing protein n=1 Tax=Oceanicola sp. S124 TaxID=1042378 RepID=UPI001ED8D393
MPGHEAPAAPSAPTAPAPGPASGQQVAAAAQPAPPPLPEAQPQQLGSVTHLPLPRFVSMKSDKANIRRGPSKTHRIDWVFLRRDMPVEVVAEYGHWRQIRDHDGVGGWVHYVLLSGNRTVLVQEDMLALRFQPSPEARVIARLESGVIADLDKCDPEWCRLEVNGYRGWAPKSALWGVDADEIRD